MSWEAFANPYAHILKKFAYKFLGDRLPRDEEVLERISAQLVTKKDVENFGKFMADLYELGYQKAIDDHRDKLRAMEYKTKIVQEPQTSEHKIFKD